MPTSAVNTSVPVARWRTPAPRQNSCAIVIITNAHSAKHSPEDQNGTPNATTAPPVTTPATVGQRNEWNMLPIVDLRHASNGPRPVRNSRMRPTGVRYLLKNGAATVLRPCPSASLIVGNIVENSTKNAANSRTQLLA